MELLDSRDDIIKSSKSTMNVVKSAEANTADHVFEMPGLQIGVYNACYTENEKIIIYLEGIDPLDIIPSQGKGIDEIYEDMIHNEYIEELRNFNYSFYIVNWKRSTIDMRFNALHVINLIEKLKKDYELNDEQLVIIGESMGGVIGRYALTFMESEAYQLNDYSDFFVDAASPGNAQYLDDNPELYTLGMANKDSELKYLMHKTRELITIDSPHQGANIPLSIQHAYKKAMGMVFPNYQKYTSGFNVGLEAHAVKQLLIYHLKGKVNPLLQTSAYGAAPEFNEFFQQLESIGNYPKYCKIMALSSGALNGNRQVDLAGISRMPNDQILDFETSYNAKILKWKLPIFGAELKMLTNPNGTANIFQTGIGMYSFIIKLKWFGFKVTTGYVGLLTDSQDAVNVRAHCVSAGGHYQVYGLNQPNYYDGTASDHQTWGVFGPFGSSVSNMDGCLTTDSTFGFNGVFGAHNVSYSLCTKGFRFGFIPLQSALDYGNGLGISLDHNIQSENINTKLSRTPFAVIMGYPNGVNEWHLDYRDEKIYNVTKVPASFCGPYDGSGALNYGAAYYDADQLMSLPKCEIKRSILCQEIGDEELYLENWKLNRRARFQAEYDLLVNVRNPYYKYPSQSTTINFMDGIYSKEADFTVSSAGYAKFYFNQTNSPTGIGLLYANPQTEGVHWDKFEDEMTVCIEDYATGMIISDIDDSDLTYMDAALLSDRKEFALNLIPNPAKFGVVECRFDLKEENTSFTLQLRDAMGKLITTLTSDTSDMKHNSILLDISKLTQGIYFISLISEGTREIEKLIIQN